MSFECPRCNHRKTLRIVNNIELPPDARSDEISLQVVRCSDCGYEGLAVYEESSRGAFGSESVDHYGYDADPEVIRSVKSLMKRCSKPKDPRCGCQSHHKLYSRDESGRWIRPGLEPGQLTYPIKL